MSKLIDGVFYARPEPNRECQFCHQQRECRPYGPGKRDICYDCSQKPEYRPFVDLNFKSIVSKAAHVEVDESDINRAIREGDDTGVY